MYNMPYVSMQQESPNQINLQPQLAQSEAAAPRMQNASGKAASGRQQAACGKWQAANDKLQNV